MASLSTYCILCPSFALTRWHKFRQRIILRRVSKSELPCYNGIHVSSWPRDSSTWLNVSNSSRRSFQSSFGRTLFSLAGDPENWPGSRSFFMDRFCRVVCCGKTGREIIFFLELRSPYSVWFVMAWHFKPERQKLRWYFINVTYTSILLHITHDANVVVVVHIFCR